MHDVIVVGGGLAGLQAAVGLIEQGVDVALLSRVHPLRSHSVAAQGGINASLCNAPEGQDDSPDRHAYDTVKGSDFLADQPAVRTMCGRAREIVMEIEHRGAAFSRFGDGTIAQRPFGGGAFPRTCYAADRTGHVLLHTLYEQTVKQELRIYEEQLILSLIVRDGRVLGVVALDMATGEIRPFGANAVVLVTGGYGRLYGRSTNALINTGSGIALAYRAGVPLKDMEFVQFHPTTLFGTNILITEGARGEGGLLLNRKGCRFMEGYAASAMELAPRDIVARATQTEIEEGRAFGEGYVHLDLRHLGRSRILERLPGIRDIALDFAGVDPVTAPLPVLPGQHYSMGGVDVDPACRTELPGLYAAGECACVSVHGANRLGGNSLLETLVFGKITSETVVAWLGADRPEGPSFAALKEAASDVSASVARLFERSSDALNVYDLKEALGGILLRHAGIFRTERDLSEGMEEVQDLQRRASAVRLRYRGKTFNQELLDALELPMMIELAEVVLSGALQRRESRGSHFRRDFPERNDAEFLCHTLARRDEDGHPVLGEKDVEITEFRPEARTY